MGVDCVSFQRLVELAARPEKIGGRGLMLGRQQFRVQGRFRRFYRMWLKMHDLDIDASDVFTDDDYAETLFDKLGFGEMESLDYSPYEGASVVHDLNQPIPEELHGQFDFIYDGGTLEHVFNMPMAVTNVFNLLKDDGVFVSVNGMNGWLFHGFYQFNPEFVWSFWNRMAGCEVLRCMAVSENPRIAPINLPDVAARGKRLRVPNFPDGRVYLYYEVRKTPGAKIDGLAAYQSDYQASWTRAVPEAEAMEA